MNSLSFTLMLTLWTAVTAPNRFTRFFSVISAKAPSLSKTEGDMVDYSKERATRYLRVDPWMFDTPRQVLNEIL